MKALSSIRISVADLNNNGHLDLLVPAYSTKFSRQLPAHMQAFASHGDKWRADLGRMIEQRLQWAGVTEIRCSETCTAKNPAAWFSHRRDGRCGRMASLIWLA